MTSTSTMTSNQLELGFDGNAMPMNTTEEGRPVGRTEWWFHQMRRVVDLAMEWKPVPAGRHEQAPLALQHRKA